MDALGDRMKLYETTCGISLGAPRSVTKRRLIGSVLIWESWSSHPQLEAFPDRSNLLSVKAPKGCGMPVYLAFQFTEIGIAYGVHVEAPVIRERTVSLNVMGQLSP